MNIVFNGAGEAYGILIKPPIQTLPGMPFREREAWRGEEEDANQPRSFAFAFAFSAIELPSPFESLNVSFGRMNQHYRMNVLLSSRDNSVFYENSPFIQEYFKEKGRIFVPTTLDSTGYFLNESGQIQIAVMDVGAHLEKRLMGMGSNGSNPLKLADEIDFRRNFKTLELAVNLFFNACMQSHIVAKKIKPLPDLTVNLNP